MSAEEVIRKFINAQSEGWDEDTVNSDVRMFFDILEGSGYKLVPVEPSSEMLQSGSTAYINGHTLGPNYREIYRAMLEASE